MLPPEVVSYLESSYLGSRQPCCFSIDANYQLKKCWSNTELLGLDSLDEGASVIDCAPFLLGTLIDKVNVLPFVNDSQGNSFEVHCIPNGQDYFVLLLDVRGEHKNLQQTQQIANELRLIGVSQKKMIRRQSELINDLVETKSELDHKRREAERSNAKKNEFIAMMSHEFRTPLASIINYSDLALDKYVTPVDIRKSSEAISRASRHLAALVDTILDQAQLETENNATKERPFEVVGLVNDLTTIMAPMAAEKGLSFAAYLHDKVPNYLLADENGLRQILVNLLGNAVKFTANGSVTLEIDWQNGSVLATVTDTGSGIEPEDKDRIFRAFERGYDQDQNTGTGLGLAISLDLASQMDGKIDIESEQGVGSAICLSVPAQVANDLDIPVSLSLDHSESFNASKEASILICDDDEDMRELYEYYLHRAGYGLILAKDGREAVAKVSVASPDLVLMDIFTPRLSGLEAAEYLRKSGFTNPIIAVSASHIDDVQQSPFNDRLQKPFQMPELLALIKEYLN